MGLLRSCSTSKSAFNRSRPESSGSTRSAIRLPSSLIEAELMRLGTRENESDSP